MSIEKIILGSLNIIKTMSETVSSNWLRRDRYKKILILIISLIWIYIVSLLLTPKLPNALYNLEQSTSYKDVNMLFIVADGSGGGTLLRHLLNSIPNYIISGENKNAVYFIRSLYNVLKIAKREICYAYMEGLPRAIRDEYFRKIILDLLVSRDKKNNYKVFGFKEIRFIQIYELEFLLKLFPNSKFIIHYRSNVNSYQNPGVVPYFVKHAQLRSERLQEQIKMFKQFERIHPDVTRIITEETFDLQTINKMLIESQFLRNLPPNFRFSQIPILNGNSKTNISKNANFMTPHQQYIG
ncbi:hypothetical protein SNEBB_000220 [Seison nebaliae]|nr:hypothetical protein SNEBB_000220 [Seison nebaliae]